MALMHPFLSRNSSAWIMLNSSVSKWPFTHGVDDVLGEVGDGPERWQLTTDDEDVRGGNEVDSERIGWLHSN